MANIVITGASSLIGKAITKKLAANGDSVLLHTFSNLDSCTEFAKTLDANCTVTQADFANRNEVDAFCQKLGTPDVLINAAACTIDELLPNLTDQDVSRMVEVNILALVSICRAAIPGMMTRRNGIIVNISSVAALRGTKGLSVYAGTKGFVESFTRTIAAEYGGRGIRANTVAPGAINAGSLKKVLAYGEVEVKKCNSSGKLGSPEDVASAVAFLCSPQSSFINGACINVSGGFMAGV